MWVALRGVASASGDYRRRRVACWRWRGLHNEGFGDGDAVRGAGVADDSTAFPTQRSVSRGVEPSGAERGGNTGNGVSGSRM